MAVLSIDITSREPFAGGQPFEAGGAYEEIKGTLTYGVDPGHAANAGITDLQYAPRDAAGLVRFRSDFAILKPVDDAKRNGRLLVDVVNRGRKLIGSLNHAAALEGPAPVSDPGDGFLFRHGWTVASIGWQWDVLRTGGLLGFDAPLVLQDGLQVRGQSIITIRPNDRETTYVLANRVHASYPAVRVDDPDAVLYVRDYEDGEDTVVPREAWSFARETSSGNVTTSNEHVYMKGGFEPGKVYNLTYTAEGARVVGAGLLALREAACFLRLPAGEAGNGSQLNPTGGFERAYAYGVSQTGRMLRHFLYLGLNRGEDGTQAYDGMLVHVAGARRGEFNHRFGQPSQQMTHTFGQLFPFADDETVDPYSERRDGLLAKLRADGSTPKLIYTNTSAEYWRGDAALVHIDPTGAEDLPGAPETRVYHFAGTQHGAGSLPQKDRNPNEGTRGRYGFNVVDYAPLLRAALTNLDAWVTHGTEPPPSTHPRLADATLVEQPVTLKTFETLPGQAVPDASKSWGIRELNLGPRVGEGIAEFPVKLGRRYPRLVPAVDADGNEVTGIRLPDITVPVATNTGWNPRHPDTGAPELIISMMGQTRFFPATAAQRRAKNDPRASLEERYTGKDAYLQAVRQAAERLVEQRYVLAEDVPMLLDNASSRWDAALAANGA
jgi:hypothetical protein